MTQRGKIWLATLLIIAAFLVWGMITVKVSPLVFESIDEGFVQLLSYCLIFFLTIGFTYAIRKPFGLFIPSFRPEPGKINPRLVILGVILTFAASVILNPIIDAMPEENLDRLTSYMQGGLWPMLTAVVAAPILEEFLFRGIIQHNLIKILGRIGGIVIGAVIFGAIHFIPQQVIYATGAGIIIGTIYYMTDSLHTVMTIHFVNNGLAYLLFMVFGSTNYIESEILGDKTIFLIAYLVSFVILMSAGWYAVRRLSGSKKRAPKTKEN